MREEIDRLLKVEDIMRIFDYSRVSVYRMVREMREGKESQIPRPLDSGYKRSLRWCRRSVEAFCQARTVPQPPVSIPSPTKQGRRVAKEQEHRRKATKQILERHGIVPNNDNGQEAAGKSLDRQ